MSTEHVIQIGVSVDDDAIQSAILNHAANEVLKGLKDGFFRRGCYGKLEFDYKIKDVISDETKKFLENNKDEFMRLLVSDVSDRLMRSKKFKEEVVGEMK